MLFHKAASSRIASKAIGATRSMSGKDIKFGVEGRAAMLNGVNLLADAVQVSECELVRLVSVYGCSQCERQIDGHVLHVLWWNGFVSCGSRFSIDRFSFIIHHLTSSILFLLFHSLFMFNSLLLFTAAVHNDIISFSFFWIVPSSRNPATLFLSKRTDAPLLIRSSIRVRQKVSMPPNLPRQGAIIRIFRLDKSAIYQRFNLVFFHLLICLSV